MSLSHASFIPSVLGWCKGIQTSPSCGFLAQQERTGRQALCAPLNHISITGTMQELCLLPPQLLSRATVQYYRASAVNSHLSKSKWAKHFLSAAGPLPHFVPQQIFSLTFHSGPAFQTQKEKCVLHQPLY